MTLADTFSIVKTVGDLTDVLNRIVSGSRPIEITAMNNEFFGPNQETEVTIYQKNDEIKKLHFEIVEALQGLGVTFNEPQYTKDGFKPHSTVQQHAKVKVGDRVSINNLALVDMYPNENPYKRKILKKISIK